MRPGTHICIWAVSLIAVLSGRVVLADSVETTRTGNPSESSLLLRNIQFGLSRLGCNIAVVPLPESTSAHIYAEPAWDSSRKDPLMRRLQNRGEWKRDDGFFHRLEHRGSHIGFRQRTSPSLHISVYPRGSEYIYEMHYDRFLALGRKPIASLKHIFGEVLPNRFFGKHTSQEHISLLLLNRARKQAASSRDIRTAAANPTAPVSDPPTHSAPCHQN